MNIVRELYEDTDHPIVFALIFIATLAASTYTVYLIVADWIATLFAVTVALGMFALIYYAALDEQPENYRELVRWLVDLKRPTRYGIAFGLLIILLTMGLEITWSLIEAVMLPSTEPATHATVESSPPDGQALLSILFYIVIAGPLVEEIIYRGVIQRFLAYATNTPLAIVVASVLFALAHIPAYGGIGTPLEQLSFPLVAVFTNGLLWGWLYYRTENVTVCFVSHAGWNAIAMIAWLA